LVHTGIIVFGKDAVIERLWVLGTNNNKSFGFAEGEKGFEFTEIFMIFIKIRLAFQLFLETFEKFVILIFRKDVHQRRVGCILKLAHFIDVVVLSLAYLRIATHDQLFRRIIIIMNTLKT
jgi:hypothetical protein